MQGGRRCRESKGGYRGKTTLFFGHSAKTLTLTFTTPGVETGTGAGRSICKKTGLEARKKHWE